MKIIAINGSPRTNFNTAALLKNALAGANAQGAETEMVNLYRLNYKGCISCFSCKRKDGRHGVCAMKDELTPVLEKLHNADAIVFGSPLYYFNITSGMSALMERFLFSHSLYDKERRNFFEKKIPSAFIYTMGMPEVYFKQIDIEKNLSFIQRNLEEKLQFKPEILYSYDTYQFTDYSKYEASVFDIHEKEKTRKTQFPLDLEAAYSIGERLVTSAKEV